MTHTKRAVKTPVEGGTATPRKLKKTKLYIALETISESRNRSVTPTLKRMAKCALSKFLRMNGKKG